MLASTDLRAVVFDLDGLMFNTEDLYDMVGEGILSRRGHHYTPELKRRMMGLPGRVSLQIMIDAHGLDATVEQLQDETDEIFAEILPVHLQPMPGLLELLNSLDAASIPKAIATSSRRAYTQTVLAQFDLETRFEFLLTSEDVSEGKPHPEIYQTAASRLGVGNADVMVLEDSENGCKAGVAAGSFTVAVPGVHSEGHDYPGVAFVAESLQDQRIYRSLGLPDLPS